MYPHPFSAGYWRDASREVRDLRKLLFSALMIALCIVLAQVPSVPLFGGAKVTWGFLALPSLRWTRLRWQSSCGSFGVAGQISFLCWCLCCLVR